jgi:hypothetical protein
MLLTLGSAAFGQSQAADKALIREAQLVFRGTVQKVGAANLAAVSPAGDTAIVRVDEILKAPVSLRDVSGQEVTVKLREPHSVQPGDTATFFANGWLYGERLALLEIGRSRSDVGVLKAQITGEERQLAEEKLRAQVAGAELAVVGRVVETRPARVVPVGEGELATEHNPEWREAVIEVESTLKGKASTHRIVFLYPNSRDVMWVEAPKPNVGSRDLWLLYRDQIPELKVPGYTALKSWNRQPPSQAETVKRLVAP